MKIQIPKTFECGGSIIRVETVKNLKGRNGEWLGDKNLIRLQQADPAIMFETFLHELNHAIRDRYGHWDADEIQEERIVEGMAQGFCQFLKSAQY